MAGFHQKLNFDKNCFATWVSDQFLVFPLPCDIQFLQKQCFVDLQKLLQQKKFTNNFLKTSLAINQSNKFLAFENDRFENRQNNKRSAFCDFWAWYENSVACANVRKPQLNVQSTDGRLLIITLIEEVKITIVKKCEFESRVISKIVWFFHPFGPSLFRRWDSDPYFSIELSFSGLGLERSVEPIMKKFQKVLCKNFVFGNPVLWLLKTFLSFWLDSIRTHWKKTSRKSFISDEELPD